MKKAFLLFLLCISFTYQSFGPTEKRRADSSGSCGGEAESTSDCVDLKLSGYTDEKCCYIRYQVEGGEAKGCVALTSRDYLDIVEFKRNYEKKYYEANYKDVSEGKRIKVYEINCSSSYIKFLTFACILFALLF